MIEAAEERASDDLIGTVLANRYLVEQRLGEGAMGTVFKARHVKVGRPFAVKVLHRRLLEDNKVAQRFEREAELAGRLRHANVVGVVDVGETPDGLRYMVMDFAAGQDLADMLVEAPMPPERIIHLVRQMLEGLYHAHEQGLIHRDFKPENVIIEKNDHGLEVPRIVDFGIAILREGGDSTNGAGRLTTNGLVLGTPHYMAPEQAVADPIDHRIDLFALGIVIYEMLSGKLPFDGNGAEVARANLLLDPPLIAQRVPYLEVDPLLEAYARRLMAKKRDMRPATAKAARELLDLIDRDREAAAAALGVPIALSSRIPAVTADVAPQAATPHDGDRAFAPTEMPTPAPVRAQQLEAPPVPARVARPASQPSAEARPARPSREDSIQTDPASPLPFDEDDRPPRRRAPWVIGGFLAIAAAGTAAVFAFRSDDTPAPAVASKPPAPVPEITQPAPTPTTPTTTTTPTPTPAPTVTQPEPPPPVVDTPVRTEPTPRPAKAKKPPVAVQKAVQLPQTPGPVTKSSVETPPAPPAVVETAKPPPVEAPKPPPPPPAITPRALGALYGAVGAEIRAASRKLGPDTVNALNARYLLIQINDAMANDATRTAAEHQLVAIRNELAKLH